MKIIRVFPRRTSYTPTDPMAFVGDPPLFRPDADQIHISVTFTWDKPEGARLFKAWSQFYSTVSIGGPAYGFFNSSFTPGLYIKPGYTFTTRGCNSHCPWCLVPSSEGRLTEIVNFSPGHIICDNNLLQASNAHIESVFTMLRSQSKAAVFSGGIQSSLVTPWFADLLKSIRVDSVFLAADTTAALEPLAHALDLLSFLGRERLRVYVLIGRETIQESLTRLEAVWSLGALPFAQLYQPPDHFIEYDRVWRKLAKYWSRPAYIKAMHKIKPDPYPFSSLPL